MAYTGTYKVKNRKKYRGNPDDVVFRSLWERQVMKYLDLNPSVLQWSSEELRIRYLSPLDARVHFYYPDFWAEVINDKGKLETIVIEVKPLKQTAPPKKPKFKNKAYSKAFAIWMVNKAKWLSAIDLCESNGWKFKIITEKNLKTGYKY